MPFDDRYGSYLNRTDVERAKPHMIRAERMLLLCSRPLFGGLPRGPVTRLLIPLLAVAGTITLAALCFLR